MRVAIFKVATLSSLHVICYWYAKVVHNRNCLLFHSYRYFFTLAQEAHERQLASGSVPNANSLPKVGMRLKSLAHYILGRKIQVGKGGHCSVEDAQATLDLYLTVKQVWMIY